MLRIGSVPSHDAVSAMGAGFVIWNDWDRHIRLFGFRYGQAHFWVGAVVFIAAPLLFLALRRRRVVGHSTRFNAGQQLNLRAMQASLPFMLVTGTENIMPPSVNTAWACARCGAPDPKASRQAAMTVSCFIGPIY